MLKKILKALFDNTLCTNNEISNGQINRFNVLFVQKILFFERFVQQRLKVLKKKAGSYKYFRLCSAEIFEENNLQGAL